MRYHSVSGNIWGQNIVGPIAPKTIISELYFGFTDENCGPNFGFQYNKVAIHEYTKFKVFKPPY